MVENRQIYGVAIDTASIDYGRSRLFPSHRILARHNIFNVENLNTKELDSSFDLDQALLVVSPLKISTGSGSPVRPILLYGMPKSVLAIWARASNKHPTEL